VPLAAAPGEESVAAAPALLAWRTDEEAGEAAAPATVLRRDEALPEDDGRARAAAAMVTVLDGAGRPLPEAVVEAAGGGAVDRRTTDALGRATVRLPAAEVLSVTAMAAGHLRAGCAEHPFGAELTLRLPRAARLLATVQDAAGRPVGGVRVFVRGQPRVAGSTGADGHIVLDGIRPGTHDVSLHSDPEAGVLRAHMMGGLYLPEGDNAHTFVLPAGAAVTGTVVQDGSGSPLAGATVRLHWQSRGGALRGFGRLEDAVTGAAGGFAFTGVGPGRIRVEADTPGHAAAAHEQDVFESGGEVRIAFALVPAAVVRGRVRDAARAPVAGAAVTLGFGEPAGLRFAHGTLTGADGRFELPDVPPRDGLLLVASAPGRAEGGALLGKVRPGEVREGVEIDLRRGVAVRGRVRGASGMPLLGAEVRLVPTRGAERYARTTTTDAAGVFRFEEVVGFPYRIEARAPEHLPATVELTVSDSRPENDAGELSLRRACSLAGIVSVRGSGIGQAGVRVNVRDPAGKGARRGLAGSATTDDFGRFTVTGLPEGDYLVDVRGPEVQPQTPLRVRLPHDGRLLRLAVDVAVPPETGIVSMRVCDAATRAPIAGVEFGGIDRRRVAYEDGMYSLRGIPGGTVELRLRAGGYQPARLAHVAVLPGRVRRLDDVALQRAASVRARVVDERGRPFRAGQVRLQLVDTQHLTAAEALAPAAADPQRGVWTWDGLALSRFELRVRGPGTHAPRTQVVDVWAPQAAEVRVQLARKPRPPPAPTGGRVR
jgi:protocatechuate 3,4-dioxygenase beta subunit